MPKVRLDLLLVERGLAESRSKAQALVMAGQVRVDGQVELKSSAQIPLDAQLDLEMGPRFVSRGGDKLETALLVFPLEIGGRTCADVGASTGGTACSSMAPPGSIALMWAKASCTGNCAPMRVSESWKRPMHVM